jgi:HAD superfamily hydrolase (TIGR01509 family)
VARGAGPRAVIFDLDGVLVDSEIWWDEVRADFARAHGRTWTAADRAAVMGANSRQWARTMRERLGLDLADDEITRAVVDGVVARYLREGPPTIDGVVDAVRRIADGRPLAVASSAHPDVIAAALESTGLGALFTVVVSSDEVARGKPAPDVYLEAARRLGADPARTLVVEDSLNGVRAARAAGMTVVLVPNRSVPPAPGTAELADAVVDRLADLDPDAVNSRPQPELPGPPIHPPPNDPAPARPDRRVGPRPFVPAPACRRARACGVGAGRVLLQSPELGRSVRARGRPAAPATAVLLRPEGGGHGGRRA